MQKLQFQINTFKAAWLNTKEGCIYPVLDVYCLPVWWRSSDSSRSIWRRDRTERLCQIISSTVGLWHCSLVWGSVQWVESTVLWSEWWKTWWSHSLKIKTTHTVVLCYTQSHGICHLLMYLLNSHSIFYNTFKGQF